MRNLMMFALLIFMLIAAQVSKAQTADEIVDKYLEVLGGKAKMLTLQTVKLDGSLNVQGMDVSVITTIKNGVGVRTDISVPGMGEGYQIMNTAKGWNFMPFQGQSAPEEVSAEDVKSGQSSLDVQGSLVNYKEKGSQLELLGKEKTDGVDAYKLKLTNKAGRVSTIFIDAANYHRIKVIAKAKTPAGEEDMETTFGDFKKNADGFLFPYTQTNARGTIVFSNIETNKPVDDKIFTAN